ncbi:hypothetical protein LTR16_011564, partial [Cryomyces antarcticus]
DRRLHHRNHARHVRQNRLHLPRLRRLARRRPRLHHPRRKGRRPQAAPRPLRHRRLAAGRAHALRSADRDLPRARRPLPGRCGARRRAPPAGPDGAGPGLPRQQRAQVAHGPARLRRLLRAAAPPGRHALHAAHLAWLRADAAPGPRHQQPAAAVRQERVRDQLRVRR